MLFTLEDGLDIETVVIPCERGRNTVCVSSQVGCAMNCQFCYTGRQGLLYETCNFMISKFCYIWAQQGVFFCLQDGSEEKFIGS